LIANGERLKSEDSLPAFPQLHVFGTLTFVASSFAAAPPGPGLVQLAWFDVSTGWMNTGGAV